MPGDGKQLRGCLEWSQWLQARSRGPCVGTLKELLPLQLLGRCDGKHLPWGGNGWAVDVDGLSLPGIASMVQDSELCCIHCKPLASFSPCMLDIPHVVTSGCFPTAPSAYGMMGQRKQAHKASSTGPGAQGWSMRP